MGEEQKTSIIGKAEVSKEKMMSWAKNKNNNEEYLFVMDLAWGERKTFTLPKAFVNDLKSGTIKSVIFYTSDGINYIKFSAVCTLRLRVNK